MALYWPIEWPAKNAGCQRLPTHRPRAHPGARAGRRSRSPAGPAGRSAVRSRSSAGPVEGEGGDRLAERRVGGREGLGGGRVGGRQRLAHADRLRPLAGEDERDRAHRLLVCGRRGRVDAHRPWAGRRHHTPRPPPDGLNVCRHARIDGNRYPARMTERSTERVARSEPRAGSRPRSRPPARSSRTRASCPIASPWAGRCGATWSSASRPSSASCGLGFTQLAALYAAAGTATLTIADLADRSAARPPPRPASSPRWRRAASSSATRRSPTGASGWSRSPRRAARSSASSMARAPSSSWPWCGPLPARSARWWRWAWPRWRATP